MIKLGPLLFAMRKSKIVVLLSIVSLLIFRIVLTGASDQLNLDKSPEEIQFLPFVSNTPPVVIKELHYQSTPPGDVRIIGEVVSIVEIPVFNVTIGISGTYSNTNELFKTTTVFTATLPSKINVFDVYIPGGMEGVEIFIQDYDLTNQRAYAPVEVTNIETTGCCGTIYVTAELKNSNPFPLVNVVGFAFSWGSFSSLSLVEAAEYLAVGESVQFETLLQGIGEFAPVFALGQGEIPP